MTGNEVNTRCEAKPAQCSVRQRAGMSQTRLKKSGRTLLSDWTEQLHVVSVAAGH